VRVLERESPAALLRLNDRQSPDLRRIPLAAPRGRYSPLIQTGGDLAQRDSSMRPQVRHDRSNFDDPT
jgi:hypothetical protein